MVKCLDESGRIDETAAFFRNGPGHAAKPIGQKIRGRGAPIV